MAQSNRVYFAARKRSEIGKALQERLRPLLTDETRTHREEMRNAYCHVYGRDVGAGITSGVTRGGERGELALLRVNTATAAVRARHAIISSAQVTWKPEARDGGGTSAACTLKAQDVLEDMWKSQGLAEFCANWLLMAAQFGEWFAFPEWDRTKGPPLLATPRRGLIRQGDLCFRDVAAWDVYRDASAKRDGDCQWRFMRMPANRFDLAAAHTQLPNGLQGEAAREAILSAADKATYGYLVDADGERFRDSDQVYKMHFFHEPSATLPMGRHVVLLDELVRRS